MWQAKSYPAALRRRFMRMTCCFDLFHCSSVVRPMRIETSLRTAKKRQNGSLWGAEFGAKIFLKH